MIAFIVVSVLTFAVLALDGYAKHMGHGDPSDWGTMLVVAVLAGFVGMGLWIGFLEATAIVSGILS